MYAISSFDNLSSVLERENVPWKDDAVNTFWNSSIRCIVSASKNADIWEEESFGRIQIVFSRFKALQIEISRFLPNHFTQLVNFPICFLLALMVDQLADFTIDVWM